MPRVLLITNVYPPSEFIGAVRPAALAKYLPQFGWETVVLTPRINGGSRQSKLVIETENRDVLEDWKARLSLDHKRTVHEQFGLPAARKPGYIPPHTRVLNFVRHLVTYPHPSKGWIPFALAAIQELRRQNHRFDAVISTSPPITTHLIACQAKRILGCPWIADLRDLWTQNLNPNYSIVQLRQTGLEKRTLGQADAIVTVSEPWADRLRERYSSKSIYAITNGFDPEDFLPRPRVTSQFSITHAGLLYEGRRDPTLLFEVIRDLIKSGEMNADDIRIRFYGPREQWLIPLVQQHGLAREVEILGSVSREDVLQHEMESQILFLLGWNDPREVGLHNGKLFEYLGAGRPILALFGSPGVMSEVLEETRAGSHLQSREELRRFLISSYSEYKRYGQVRYAGDASAIAQYTHANMAQRFANVLEAATGAPGNKGAETPASAGLLS
jgi:glycosyltransferase involved in cell wall biosynthesis